MEKASSFSCLLFPKSHRLLKVADFVNLRKDFKKKFVGPFLLIYKKNTLANSRLGIAISKKSANAIYRNKVKRIIREDFRKHEIRAKNYDLLVIFNKKQKVKDHKISLFSGDIQSLFSEVMS